jgi:hypothetical protein
MVFAAMREIVRDLFVTSGSERKRQSNNLYIPMKTAFILLACGLISAGALVAQQVVEKETTTTTTTTKTTTGSGTVAEFVP